MPAGRPSDYTPELAKRVIDALSSTPATVEEVLASDPDFPAPMTFYDWQERHEEFRASYARVKPIRSALLMAEARRIADEVDPDEGNGNARVKKATLQVAVRERWAEAFDPGRWGKATKIEHSGEVGLSFADLASKAAGNGSE